MVIWMNIKFVVPLVGGLFASAFSSGFKPWTTKLYKKIKNKKKYIFSYFSKISPSFYHFNWVYSPLYADSHSLSILFYLLRII